MQQITSFIVSTFNLFYLLSFKGMETYQGPDMQQMPHVQHTHVSHSQQVPQVQQTHVPHTQQVLQVPQVHLSMAPSNQSFSTHQVPIRDKYKRNVAKMLGIAQIVCGNDL